MASECFVLFDFFFFFFFFLQYLGDFSACWCFRGIALFLTMTIISIHRDLRRRARSDCVWRRNNHTTTGQTSLHNCILPSGWGTSGEAFIPAEYELAEARGEYIAVSRDKRKGRRLGGSDTNDVQRGARGRTSLNYRCQYLWRLGAIGSLCALKERYNSL